MNGSFYAQFQTKHGLVFRLPSLSATRYQHRKGNGIFVFVNPKGKQNDYQPLYKNSYIIWHKYQKDKSKVESFSDTWLRRGLGPEAFWYLTWLELPWLDICMYTCEYVSLILHYVYITFSSVVRCISSLWPYSMMVYYV